MRRTPSENMLLGLALAPQSLATTVTANGPRIVNPGRLGENLSILFTGVFGAGVSAFSARLEGSNDNGATWAPVKQNDGLTDLAFTGARFIDGGAADGVPVIGTIKPGRGKYTDYRLAVVTNTGGTSLVSAHFIIWPLTSEPAGVDYPATFNAYGQAQPSVGQLDEWLNSFLPTGS